MVLKLIEIFIQTSQSLHLQFKGLQETIRKDYCLIYFAYYNISIVWRTLKEISVDE